MDHSVLMHSKPTIPISLLLEEVMLKREQEEELLERLKSEEQTLHEALVSATHELRIARQQVSDIEAKLQMTMAQLNHVRRQMNAIWQAAP
jgi:predicted  nucleic acid-binding Zn-ribbon protein